MITAQERQTLQSLLVARDQAVGRSGVIEMFEGEKFESLAVLDRRIAECRARIAWFEAAADGNDLPGASWAGLSGGTAR